MSALTGIEWTDRTWNPVVGCTRVSPGCAHCYAEYLHDMRHRAHRAGKLQRFPQYAVPFEQVQLLAERIRDPLGWRKPARIFVNSVSDLFHDDVPLAYLLEVFATMALAHWHTFQVLTKRPARMRALLAAPTFPRALAATIATRTERDFAVGPWPLPNVWLGVSVENQRWAIERIPLLVSTPAAVRFLSCEPLLGPVDLSGWLPDVTSTCPASDPGCDAPDDPDFACHDACERTTSIDWVITGAESGPDRRPCDLAWVRDLRDQCVDAGVPFFLKQLIAGGHVISTPELDGRTWTEMPPTLSSPATPPAGA